LLFLVGHRICVSLGYTVVGLLVKDLTGHIVAFGPWTLYRTLRHRLMPQNYHELTQVWEGLQRLDHADDAFNVRGLEAPPRARSDCAEALVATQRVGNGAAVMTALFAQL